jgi:hypothetical protein
VYIRSYAPPFLPSSSLFSLVSSISAIYKAPFYSNSILYVPSQSAIEDIEHLSLLVFEIVCIYSKLPLHLEPSAFESRVHFI